MKYQPICCIWEITMACNLRCGHCGSSCTDALLGELSTEEAMRLCDELAAMGLQWVALSGGEPFMRKDWDLLAKRLSDSGVEVHVTTNAQAIDEEVISKLKDSGVNKVAVSLDGTREVHDAIRRKGCYDQCKKAFQLLSDAGITVGAITTVLKKNVDILPQMREEITEMGAKTWQLQIGVPMGNLKEHPDWVIQAEEMEKIVDIAYEENTRGGLKVLLADCIGYYSRKETIARQRLNEPFYELPIWDGCNAGVYSFGILHNGDVVGCTSMRNNPFIEGNIRERPLQEIWADPDSFTWNRNFRAHNLKGFCRECVYALKCRGGCSNMRLSFNGSLQSENKYCLYHLHKNGQ